VFVLHFNADSVREVMLAVIHTWLLLVFLLAEFLLLTWLQAHMITMEVQTIVLIRFISFSLGRRVNLDFQLWGGCMVL